MSNFDVVTGQQITVGGLPLISSGKLSASDGTFAGGLSFQSDSTLTGNLNGRFYGPAAQELGATFSATSPDGATLNGGFTGQAAAGGETQNLTLTNVTTTQQFGPGSAILETSEDNIEGVSRATALPSSLGLVTISADESIMFGAGTSDLASPTFSPSNQVTGPANFTTYQTSVSGHPVSLSLYKPGSGNSELALTYTSFGIWREDGVDAVNNRSDEIVFTYGFQTPNGTLAARTGTGHYAGVAYGSAFDTSTATRYALSGTSVFDVNFSTQNLTGSLALKGAPQGSGATRDFGSFGVSAPVLVSGGATADMTQGGQTLGQLTTHFYGPTGEEIAGTFAANVGTTALVGAAAAKRQ